MSATSDAAAVAAWHAPFARPASVIAAKPVLKPGPLSTRPRPADANGVFQDPSLDAVAPAAPKVIG